MEENVCIHISATQEFVMILQPLVKVEKKENLAVIILNVTMVSLVDRQVFGLSEQNAFQCLKLAHNVRLNMTANQETSAGSLKRAQTAFVLRNTLHLIKLNSYGITKITQRSTRHLS